MEASLWWMTQEEEDTMEPKAYTPKKFADKTMHRLRGMKRLIEVMARVPRWPLQEMESIEATVRIGPSCNFFPEQLKRQLISLKIMPERSEQTGLEELANEVEKWIQDWQVSHDEWG
jgi:hypothetical protein